ncbi:siderophore-interacting protein [Gordonia insulae]|uniref:NADPH-dependent ferric-chelate reductase n=1 Tax=Gordonia insulae TaxID=2420509 RepID=A0A3G8JGV5_9ACTN|nr:siderophore-interacting protein [Gordonia insulae]AZG44381.1 NADPH-dependent ferric-chelate reductase [Gordonia insulae]
MTRADSAPLDLTPDPAEIRLTMYDLEPRTVEVVETTDLSAEMRRVRFAITAPEEFHFVEMATDDHIKLFFPDAETGEIVMPGIGPEGMRLPAEGRHPIYRDYTVRAYDRAAGLLDVDFVLHTHGVAGSWAMSARPGERLGMLGPRGSTIFPTGYDWYLLGADDTALPALTRWLEELPADKPVIAFVEVSGPAAEIELPARAGAEVHVLHRGSAAPGNSTLLYEAIRDHPLPGGDFFSWVAGEANSLKPVRRHLRRELGLPKQRVKVDGYWRAGTVNLDHHEADGED